MRASSPVALILSALLWISPLSAQPPVEVLAAIPWKPDIEGFGGLSALEVSADGAHFTAVSDTGMIYRATLLRDAKGRLTGAQLITADALKFENGGFPEQKRNRDTEGLAISPEGTLFVSAESKTRLLVYPSGETTAQIETLPELSPQTPSNMGFEALAISRSGALFAIAEGSPNIRAPYTIYQRTADGWARVFQLKRSGGFRPVGADFGPDGHLYILTRAFNGLGFASMIERIRFEHERPIKQERLFTSAFRQFDNLEGLALWRAGADDLRLYAISDDNFSRAQTTQIVEFRIQD